MGRTRRCSMREEHCEAVNAGLGRRPGSDAPLSAVAIDLNVRRSGEGEVYNAKMVRACPDCCRSGGPPTPGCCGTHHAAGWSACPPLDSDRQGLRSCLGGDLLARFRAWLLALTGKTGRHYARPRRRRGDDFMLTSSRDIPGVGELCLGPTTRDDANCRESPVSKEVETCPIGISEAVCAGEG